MRVCDRGSRCIVAEMCLIAGERPEEAAGVLWEFDGNSIPYESHKSLFVH